MKNYNITMYSKWVTSQRFWRRHNFVTSLWSGCGGRSSLWAQCCCFWWCIFVWMSCATLLWRKWTWPATCLSCFKGRSLIAGQVRTFFSSLFWRNSTIIIHSVAFEGKKTKKEKERKKAQKQRRPRWIRCGTLLFPWTVQDLKTHVSKMSRLQTHSRHFCWGQVTLTKPISVVCVHHVITWFPVFTQEVEQGRHLRRPRTSRHQTVWRHWVWNNWTRFLPFLVVPCCSHGATLLVTAMSSSCLWQDFTPPPSETWFLGSSGNFKQLSFSENFIFQIFFSPQNVFIQIFFSPPKNFSHFHFFMHF